MEDLDVYRTLAPTGHAPCTLVLLTRDVYNALTMVSQWYRIFCSSNTITKNFTEFLLSYFFWWVGHQDGSIRLMGNVRRCHPLVYLTWESNRCPVLSRKEWSGFGPVMTLRQLSFHLCFPHLDSKSMLRFVGNSQASNIKWMCKKSADFCSAFEIIINCPRNWI